MKNKTCKSNENENEKLNDIILFDIVDWVININHFFWGELVSTATSSHLSLRSPYRTTEHGETKQKRHKQGSKKNISINI